MNAVPDREPSPKDHLLPEVREALRLPMDRRIAFAQRDVWVNYDAAEAALRAMRDLLDQPRVVRMPCHLLLAASGNGKSTVIARFKEDHEPTIREDGGGDMPVVVMQMPSKPTETLFWSEMLNGMRIAHDVASPMPLLKQQAKDLLVMYRTRLLIVDEIHNVLQGKTGDQRHFLVVLKGLANELGLPLVAAGTKDALFALRTDPQLADRFDPLPLPKWAFDVQFLKMLATFERLLPLPSPSFLSKRPMNGALFDASRGTIGGVAKVLRKATVIAIREGAQCLTPELVEKVATRSLNDYDGTDI
jgi:hypothetical protein